jgi:endonuclease/exonuclease/phosphatase family metal-dependent hydrolase
MRSIARRLPLVALALLAACGEKSPLAPQPDLSAHAYGRGRHDITVMTRNMYVGADVDAVIWALYSPDPNDDLPALAAAVQTLQRTDFAARIRAMAHEIAENRPDVVGLQEVAELTVTPALLGLPGDPIQLDFLGALQAALAEKGLHYEVAAQNTNTDAAVAGGAIHVVDHDVLLVNSEHVTLEGDPVAGYYVNTIGQITPEIFLQRGGDARMVSIDGVEVLLVNTHLESGGDPQIAAIRYGQALELVEFMADVPRVILTGDFNDLPASQTHLAFTSASFTDTWAALRHHDPGFTCCQAADLANRHPQLNQRIDYIWTRGFTRPSGRLEGEVSLVGASPRDRVRAADGRIWPSDHAGVVARLSLPHEPDGHWEVHR